MKYSVSLNFNYLSMKMIWGKWIFHCKKWNIEPIGNCVLGSIKKEVRFHVSETEKWNFRVKGQIYKLQGSFSKKHVLNPPFWILYGITQYRFHFEIYSQSWLPIQNNLWNFCTVEQKATIFLHPSNFEIKLQV